MGNLSQYVFDGVRYFINEMAKEEKSLRERKEDSGLVWASHVAKCPKKSALRRATDEQEDFDFDTTLRMLIGTVVGGIVAKAMIKTGEETGIGVNVEEVIKTDLLSGRIDISLISPEARIDAPVEVKYTSFWYPGFNIDHFSQLCAYMYAKGLTAGVLCMVYKTDGVKVFEVLKQGDSYYAYKTTGEAVSVNYDTTLPTDAYGNVCLKESDLVTMITERKAWLEFGHNNFNAALATIGPFMNVTKIPFECAWAKYPEKYKTNQIGRAHV